MKDGARSRNIWIHNPVLYQLSYQHQILVESSGVEPEYLVFQTSAPTVYANFPYVKEICPDLPQEMDFTLPLTTPIVNNWLSIDKALICAVHCAYTVLIANWGNELPLLSFLEHFRAHGLSYLG